MNKKTLNYRELVDKQLKVLVLANHLKDDLEQNIIDFQIYYSSNMEGDGYKEFYQFYLIGDSEYYINKIIENKSLDILRLTTDYDDYYFLAVPHFGIDWGDVMTEYVLEDL